MAMMRAAQVLHPNGPLELIERETPQPGAGPHSHQGAGLRCLSWRPCDQQGLFPNIQYPRVPGHEAIGDRQRRDAGKPEFHHQ